MFRVHYRIRRYFEPLASPSSTTNICENSGIVKLAHMSVKDYLLSDTILKGPAFYFSINVKIAHSSIAENCLAYLLHFGTLDSLSGAAVISFPLARYAAEHWPSHLRLCENTSPSESLQKLLSHFFLTTSDAHANWMWLIHTRPRWDWLMPPISRIWKRAEKKRLSEDISTPLYVAALIGNHNAVDGILARATSLTSDRGWYHKALQGAAYAGQQEVVKHLLHHAPRLHMQIDRYGGSALIMAASRGHTSIVDNILQSGVDANSVSWLPSESMTMRRGHEAIMKIMLGDSDADVNEALKLHGRALHAASSAGHYQTVKSLLAHCADITALTEHGETALHQASMAGHEPVVQLLLENHAVSALNMATLMGHKEQVRALLKACVNANPF